MFIKDTIKLFIHTYQRQNHVGEYFISLHNQYPATTKLAVHTENSQYVYFNENETDFEKTLNRSKKTTLTEWFEANKNYPDTRYLKYMDFPDAYTWNVSELKWTKRKKKNNTMGRMRFIPANDSNEYNLRLLLTHVKGSLSFEDIRTVNNIIYATYKEAAIAHELLEDDTEFDKCLEEAVEIQTGKQLRDLYS